MSSNQKQPGTGASHTPRYSGSPYQPILAPPTNSYTGSDAFHNPAATYVTQTQGPNQGPGLRGIPSSGPPNQSSTPPNAELKVSGLSGPITQMQFVQNQQVRPTTAFFQPRGSGGPPTQAPRMPNQQHRAQGPPPIYQSPYVAMQPLFLQQQPASVYYSNTRPPNNMIGPQTYPHQVFSQQIAYQTYPSPTSSGVTAYTPVYPMFPSQPTPMSISRTSGTPVSATPSNTTSGNLQNAAILPQPGPTNSTYSKARQRRPNALSIIDPKTGEDKLNEIFDEANASPPASGESSARHTPQPSPPNKAVQAAFAKQVAQAINGDNKSDASANNDGIESVPVVPPENLQPPPPSVQPIAPQRYDVQNSNLQYDAKEFVSAASKPFKESTPIVSANSDAVEVILSKKDRESPVKGRKQNQREKHETSKEVPQKEPECERVSAIVKEETVSSVSSPLPNSHIPSPEVDPPVNKEVVKEHTDKEAVKNTSVEHKPSEPEANIKPAAIELIVPSNGKSKSSRNKNAHHQNGKPQHVPQQQPQPQSLPVPVPQPPKANNRSNKSKVLNIKGANKEGTDMDAFNDNSSKAEINANVLPSNENDKVANEISSEELSDVSNANGGQCFTQETAVPALSTPENDTVISEAKKMDANENITTIKSENLNVTSSTVPVAPPVNTKPAKLLFDVTSIIKDTVPKPMVSPFPMSDNRDETDRATHNDKNVLAKSDVNNKVSIENAINFIKSSLPYKPDQWAPDRQDGRKIYDKDFLLALKNHPASQQKPDNIPDSVLQDDRNRQMDGGRLAMGGRTDFTNPPFPNYGGKSGSQRGTLTKRNSQSGKMGSRGGDKNVNKPQPKVSISLRGDVKLHETENAWKPTRLLKPESVSEEEKRTEALYKKVRSVLNKLTPQKFETLVNQVRQLQIDTRERLQGVINLVFEKAIDEPNFSLAYAMMCKEIQNMQVCIGDDKKSLALRTLLVTRCQMEFEKQSIDETTRNNKVKEIEECTDPEKKKELVFDLEEYDRRLRMKSVGTIRFIGELFKQQMLTASIMRRCLQTLLDNKDEESLECLCKLLTTVGKELESKGIDLSTIFDEMKRISEGKRHKVSSRIRFMLQDVIELRASKWVPRRGDLNPKTIDQIQKEAENEHMNIQAMNVNPPRKDGPGGPRNTGPRQKTTEDGWNNVGSRNNYRQQQQQFSIQTDKIRAPKLSMDEPFGSSKLFGNWGKGAGGVKSNQMSDPISTNMYAPLENMDIDRRPLSSRSNKDPYISKGSSLERSSYKGYDGRGSRSGSQHRDSGTPIRSTGPPPSVAPLMSASSIQMKPQIHTPAVQPAVSSAQVVPKLSEEQIERRIRNSLDEYISGCATTSEYFQDISTTVPPSEYSKVIYESYNYILEKAQSARLKAGELFAKLIKSGNIALEDFVQGFEELLGYWEDLIIDIPQIWQFFAEDIVYLFLEEVLPFSRLQKVLDSLIKTNVAKKLLKSLFSLIVKEKGPNFLQQTWQKSGVQLSDFMPSTEVQAFVQETNLQFLLGGDLPLGQSQLSYEEIQKKLSAFLRNRAAFDEIVNWISANVGDRVTENKFIRALATAIFENSISKNKFQGEVLTNYSKLIQKYVDNNMDYELQCLYALQSLVHKLEHPQGVLLQLCDKLYEDSTFCQESFIAWESSTDPAEQEGKGVALKQLTSFFTQLKENEEEDEFSSSEDA